MERVVLHLDMDAFYAAVEVREDPSLAGKPLIIGHRGRRGVVSTCSYEARRFGVRSAMPSVTAARLCPDAIWVSGRMSLYSEVSRAIRKTMREFSPVVEPLSIDEAFLDLGGTARLHGKSAAMSLADLAHRIEDEIGITVSIGLSHNKFLAKIASDFDKPRGFSIIGKDETLEFLAAQPVSLIWGVGKALQRKLARDGIRTIGQLQTAEKNDLIARYGSIGSRLHYLSRGEDHRSVSPHGGAKSISAETTFNTDIAALDDLERRLWSLSERVARRAKASGLAGETVVLTPGMLSATDVDDADSSLQFSVWAVDGGWFELTSDPGAALTSFTQAQLSAGQVVFVDDGDARAPSYTLVVGDGAAPRLGIRVPARRRPARRALRGHEALDGDPSQGPRGRRPVARGDHGPP